jgi:hypothetical protein
MKRRDVWESDVVGETNSARQNRRLEIAPNGPAAGRPPSRTQDRSAQADLAAKRPFDPISNREPRHGGDRRDHTHEANGIRTERAGGRASSFEDARPVGAGRPRGETPLRPDFQSGTHDTAAIGVTIHTRRMEFAPNGPAAGRPPPRTQDRSAQADLAAKRPFDPISNRGLRGRDIARRVRRSPPRSPPRTSPPTRGAASHRRDAVSGSAHRPRSYPRPID